MKRSLLIIMVSVLVLGAAACADPAARLAKQTPDELRQLVKQSITAGNYEAAYDAAIALIEKDPESAEGYTAAATALFEMSNANFEKINSLLAQGCEKAKDGAQDIAEWVRHNEPNFAISLPFIPDYASPDQVNTVGITSGNMMNGERRGGQVTAQGEWVYFSSRSQNGALYKMSLDGESIEKLSDDSACFLNVAGDWIYYCNQSDNNKLYKIRTDGSERTPVSDDSCEYISLSNGWLYYLTLNDGFCRVRTDGSERTKLSDAFMKFPYVTGEWVYYSSKEDTGAIWRVRVDGSEEQRLSERGQWVISYCISDGWVYYLADINGMVIERMRLDGSEATEIYRYDGKISAFNVAGNRLFLSVSDKATRKDSIVIVSTETLEVEQQFDRVTEVICTVGEDWLYFADWNDGDTWYRINIDSGEIEKLR